MPELNDLDWTAVGDRTVIDCWRCLSPDQTAKIRDYRPLGQGANHDGETLLQKIGMERLALMTE
jgi:hypothetical protein